MRGLPQTPSAMTLRSWMDLVHQLDARACGPVLGDPLIVMVQPAHDRQCDHLVACLMRGGG
jgi:hypothetical protein